MIKTLTIDLLTPLDQQLKELGITPYISLDSLTDLFPPQETITDIDNGKSMCNISPSAARDKFAKEGRRGLTIREGLALIRHDPKILKSHYLDLVGSRYESRYTPSLYLRGGKPKLHAFWHDNANPGWGAPSCGSVSNLGTGNLGSLESRISALEDFQKKVEARIIL